MELTPQHSTDSARIAFPAYSIIDAIIENAALKAAKSLMGERWVFSAVESATADSRIELDILPLAGEEDNDLKVKFNVLLGMGWPLKILGAELRVASPETGEIIRRFSSERVDAAIALLLTVHGDYNNGYNHNGNNHNGNKDNPAEHKCKLSNPRPIVYSVMITPEELSHLTQALSIVTEREVARKLLFRMDSRSGMKEEKMLFTREEYNFLHEDLHTGVMLHGREKLGGEKWALTCREIKKFSEKLSSHATIEL